MRYVKSLEAVDFLNKKGFKLVTTTTQKTVYETGCSCGDCLSEKMAKELSKTETIYGFNITKKEAKELGIFTKGTCKTVYFSI